MKSIAPICCKRIRVCEAWPVRRLRLSTQLQNRLVLHVMLTFTTTTANIWLIYNVTFYRIYQVLAIDSYFATRLAYNMLGTSILR